MTSMVRRPVLTQELRAALGTPDDNFSQAFQLSSMNDASVYDFDLWIYPTTHFSLGYIHQ